MCFSPLAPAWATILVLFLLVNFIIAIGATSANNNKFVSSPCGKSLTLKDGRTKCRLHSKKRAGIDGYETDLPPNVKTFQNKHFLSDEFPSSESEVVIDNSAQGNAKQGIPIAGQMTTMKTFLYYTNDNYDILNDDRADMLKRAKRNDKIVDKNAGTYVRFDSADFKFMESTVESKSRNNIKGKDIRDEHFVFTNMSEAVSPRNAKFAKMDINNKADVLQFSTFQNQNSKGFVNAKPQSSGISQDFPGHPRDATGSRLIVDHVNAKMTRRKRQAGSTMAAVTNNRNIRAREEGDAIIGALFPLHHAPTQRTAYSRQCGEIREYYGIQRVEVFIMTLEKINRDPSILKDIKLGWDIRDSCWYSPIALENSIDFIKDAIASQSRSSSSNNDTSVPSPSLPGAPVPTSPTGSAPRGKEATKSCLDNKNLKPIVGLVGPGSSESTIQVQNLLQIFNIPQIGYSATSIDLSDKSHYKYFLRVVPPDKYQAQVLVDILVKFNWKYISTVHSDGNYGVRGMEKFTDLAKAKGVCIAVSDNVASTAEEAAFDSVLDNLLEVPNATVVVCFCEGNTVKNIFMAIRRRNMEGRFLIIGSDGWGNRLDVVEELETTAAGGISIKLYSPALSDFTTYYDKLRPSASSKNPWLNEFWEWKFKCSLDKVDVKGYSRFCLGNESLAGALEDSKLGFVVNAVTTMARALHNMHQDVCLGSKKLCPAMEPLDGSAFLQYLLNVSFKSYSGEAVHFDSQGDPPGRYEILNYQPIRMPDGNLTHDYVTIGHWMTGTLTLTGKEVYWPREGNHTVDMIKSLCSEPCKSNQAKKVKGVICCWICATCLDNEILVGNNTDCEPCGLGQWPNLNKTECEDIPVDFIDWGDTQAIVSITLGCLGICFTTWVFAIFVRYHDTPVVKASTRELSYIILVGICLAFSANFFIVAKPSQVFCYLTRILPGLSFSLIYGALVTRTNRIARILEGSKRIMTKKPRFMSATAQVVITGIIIGIECAVIAGMLAYQPADSALDYPAPKKVRLVCDTSTLGIVVPLTFDLVLIILCTLYAVKTRNLPENFNEAKFIGFTMYATCVIWLGFFPIYFAGDKKEITLCLCVSLSAAIALVLLFVPKVYVIVWVPEKNTRGAFTTSKDVRCHIGSKSMISGDSVDIKESSTCDSLFKAEKGQSKYWRQKSLDEKRLRFVMQRGGGSDGETPYINHGVLPNHSNLRNAFEDRDSKDSNKTDTTPVGSLSFPDKDRLYPVEPREITSAQIIRQNLARDYPMHKRQGTLRPGSPAEKEKHRIHSADRIEDVDSLLEASSLHTHKSAKTGDFRKSLSSTCVSTSPKTRTAQCQTSDDLVFNLLPPLHKRRVSRSKNKLERSGAVDDCVHPPTTTAKEVHVFNYPSQCNSKSLTIRRSTVSSPLADEFRTSPSNFPKLSLPVVYHSYDAPNSCSMSELDTQESSCLLGTCEENMQRRHSHNILRSDRYHNNSEPHRHGSNDPSALLLSDSRPLQTFKPDILTSSDTSELSFLEGIEKLENSVSPICQNRQNQTTGRQSKDLPEQRLSPASPRVNDSTLRQTSSHSSPSSLTHQESYYSTNSTTSSSFTLPPFPNSLDSYASNETFADSDNNFDIEDTDDFPRRKTREDESSPENEIIKIPQNTTSQCRGAHPLNSVNTCSTVSNDVPCVDEKSVEDDSEFQKYLQGHGVKLDLGTIQSSDL